MGNKVSVDKNGPQGIKVPQAHLHVNDFFRKHRAGCEAPLCEQVGKQSVRYPELQARCERDKDHRKVEDARIIRQRQVELPAVRERDICRERELQARGAREEKQRKAEEEACINRRHLEQKLKAMHERESQRQEQVKVPPLRLSLPGVCRRHSSCQGCEDPNCRGLHICRLFLADICNYGVNCRYGHSLTTAHNQDICMTYNLDTARELVLVQQIRRAYQESDELTETIFVSNFTRCFRFRSKTPCECHECNRIHICRQFVVDACGRTDCKFGHDLHTAHNNEVLRRHRLAKMADKDILDILRQKEEKRRTRQVNGAAAADSYTKYFTSPQTRPSGYGVKPNQVGNSSKPSKSSAKNGAIPRTRPSSDGAKASQNPSQPSEPCQPSKPSKTSQPSQSRDGLSEELQCPVCLEMFSRATTLGCGHTFCADCLQETRVKNGEKCPLCCANISSTIRSVALDNIIRSLAVKQ